MKHLTMTIATASMFAAGSLAFAGTAEAAAFGGSSADNAINQLQANGYNVQLNLNGTRDVPLPACTVTGVHGLPSTAPVGDPGPATQFTTVYLDVMCPPNN